MKYCLGTKRETKEFRDEDWIAARKEGMQEPPTSWRQLQLSYSTDSLAEIHHLPQGRFAGTDKSNGLLCTPAAKSLCQFSISDTNCGIINNDIMAFPPEPEDPPPPPPLNMLIKPRRQSQPAGCAHTLIPVLQLRHDALQCTQRKDYKKMQRLKKESQSFYLVFWTKTLTYKSQRLLLLFIGTGFPQCSH